MRTASDLFGRSCLPLLPLLLFPCGPVLLEACTVFNEGLIHHYERKITRAMATRKSAKASPFFCITKSLIASLAHDGPSTFMVSITIPHHTNSTCSRCLCARSAWSASLAKRACSSASRLVSAKDSPRLDRCMSAKAAKRARTSATCEESQCKQARSFHKSDCRRSILRPACKKKVCATTIYIKQPIRTEEDM